MKGENKDSATQARRSRKGTPWPPKFEFLLNSAKYNPDFKAPQTYNGTEATVRPSIARETLTMTFQFLGSLFSRAKSVARLSGVFCFFILTTSSYGSLSIEDEWGYLENKATGGRIFGKLLEKSYKDNESAAPCIVIETQSGGKIQMERSTATWHAVDASVMEYDAKVSNFSGNETAADHWKIVNWCLEQNGGKSKLRTQIELHLLKIVESDPADAEAAKMLGRDGWTKIDGSWHREEQYFASRGYIHPRRRWIPALQAQIDEITGKSEQTLGEIRTLFTRWQRQAGNVSASEAIASLAAICNETMVPLVASELKSGNNAALRRGFLDVISGIPCVASQNALIEALLNPDQTIRERALSLLLSPPFNNSTVVNRFSTSQKIISSGGLQTQLDNSSLQWMAYCLGELGEPVSVLPLVNVVRTTHKVANPAATQPGRMTTSFGNGGSGLSTGSSEPATLERTITNTKVIAALKKITGVDAGDSIDVWRNWYLDHFTLSSIDVNRN